MSAEILPRSLLETARRTRFGFVPPPTLRAMKPGEVALSPPIFMRLPNRTAEAPSDFATVLGLMAGDMSFIRTEPIAMYWESYGFPLNDTLNLQMRIVRNDEVGIARRVVSAVGLASGLRDSISTNWKETNGTKGTRIESKTSVTAVGRSIKVELRTLPAGDYVVSFEVRRGTTMVARNERRFVLTER
jgi:hypothetical protein